MKVFTPKSVLVFMPNIGIGENFGQIAPQIKAFDAYYSAPPVVGLQVIGSSSDPQISGFFVGGEE